MEDKNARLLGKKTMEEYRKEDILREQKEINDAKKWELEQFVKNLNQEVLK